MPPPGTVPAALFFAVFGSAMSLYAFVHPLAAAKLFGIDPQAALIAPSDPHDPRNPALQFVRIFGGRNLAIGLSLFTFYWRRMPRAMGTLLLCCAASGAIDTVVTGLTGTDGKAWEHAIGASLMGFVGWGMLV